jgi:hypothetical protein
MLPLMMLRAAMVSNRATPKLGGTREMSGLWQCGLKRKKKVSIPLVTIDGLSVVCNDKLLFLSSQGSVVMR